MAQVGTEIPPGVTDVNRQTQLISAIWSMTGVSAAFVALRFFSRLRLKQKLWWDDFLVVLTLIFVMAYGAVVIVYTKYGGARHAFFLTPIEASQAVMYNYIANILIISALAFGKISVALLLLRLLPPNSTKARIFLHASWGSVFVIWVALEIVILAMCRPISAFWNPTAGSCWNPAQVGDWELFTGSYYAFMDLALAAFPVSFLWKLQMSLPKKIGLCVLLGFGTLAGICAIVKTTYLTSIEGPDFTYATTDFLIWNGTEANVIIIAACIPTLRIIGSQAKDAVSSRYGSRFGFGSSKNNKSSQASSGYVRSQNSYAQQHSQHNVRRGPAQFDPLASYGSAKFPTPQVKQTFYDDGYEMGRGIHKVTDVDIMYETQARNPRSMV